MDDRRLPSLTLLLLLVGAAQAVELSDADVGEVLLFPLVTTHADYDTLISVTNTDPSRFVAARVWLRPEEGAPLGIDVHLLPGASWTAAVSGGSLVLPGETCALADDGSGLESPVSVTDPFLGTLEVIELGHLPDSHPLSSQVADGECASLASDLAAAEWQAPVGLLAGRVHLVDQREGLAFTTPPTVLDDFSALPHYPSAGESGPDLASVNPPVSRHRDGGRVVDLTWSEFPYRAVSAVLAATAIETDFTIEEEIGAATDVVLSFPTRRFHLQEDSETDARPFLERMPLLFTGRGRQGRIRPPSEYPQLGKCSPGFRAPEPVLDRDLVAVSAGITSALGLPETVPVTHVDPIDQFCGYPNQARLSELMTSGSLQADLWTSRFVEVTSDEGVLVLGLPVVATSVTRVVNGNLGGALANYALVNRVDRLTGVRPVPLVEPVHCEPLTASPLHSWVLSSDGQQLLLLRDDQVDIIDVASGGVTMLSGDFGGSRRGLASDGQSVLRFRFGRLERVSLMGDVTHSVSILPRSLDSILGISQDGLRVLARMTQTGSSPEVHLVFLDLGEVRALPMTMSAEPSPQLDPSGRFVVWVDGSTRSLQVYDAAEDEVRPLLNAAQRATLQSSDSWQINGFAMSEGVERLVVAVRVPIRGGASRSGLRYYAAETRTGAIWELDNAGGLTRPTPIFHPLFPDYLSVSADGSSAVAPYAENANADPLDSVPLLWTGRADLERGGTHPVSLRLPDGNVAYPVNTRYSDDGGRLATLVTIADAWNICVFEL